MISSKHKKIIGFIFVIIIILAIIFAIIYTTIFKNKDGSEWFTLFNSTNTSKNNYFDDKWCRKDKLELKKIFKTLNELDYFIYDETLLGFMQLGDVIPWNTNITIAIPKDSSIVIDIPENISSVYYSVVNEKIIIEDEYRDKNLTISYDDIFPLKTDNNFTDENIPVKYPQNPISIIKEIYGDKWNIECSSMDIDKKTKTKLESYKTSWYQIKYPPKASDLFKNTFVINLEKRKDKWDSTVKKLSTIGIVPQKWVAIDATNDSVRSIYSEIFGKESPNHLTLRELGCYLSHYSLWLHIKKNNIPYALILEDDVDFPGITSEKDFQEILDNSKGFDVLYYGFCLADGPEKKRRFYTHLSEKGAAMCTHAYAVSLTGVESLISYANSADVVRQLDIVTKNFCTKNLCYLSHSKPDSEQPKYWGEGIFVQDRQTLSSDIGVIDNSTR